MGDNTDIAKTEWFAIRTRLDFRAEEELSPVCEEVYFPKEEVRGPGGRKRVRAIIPRVLFLRTTRPAVLRLEREGRDPSRGGIPLWVYRYPDSDEVQVIPQRSVDLLRLLTTDDTTRCRVYTCREFKPGQRVRVTDGFFKGYEGYVRRVEKNRHVVVNIEGVCMVLLPFIHPDLLEPVETPGGENPPRQ